MFGLIKSALNPQKKPDRIQIGGVGIPRKFEPRGFLLAGAPGTGKTQTIRQILKKTRERGERAIIVDAGGDLLECFFKEGDTILNPHDARGVDWSPFSEMRAASEAETISNYMIPEGIGNDREWNGYSRVLLASLLRGLWNKDRKTNKDLIKALIYDDIKELSDLCNGTGAHRFFSEGNERMLSSILSITGSHIAPFINLNPETGSNGFSIRDYISKENDAAGWLWISYRVSNAAATTGLRRAWVDIVVNSVLSLPSNENRRIWLVIDELAGCGQLPELPRAAAQGRKFGFCLVMGMQSVMQLDPIYGKERGLRALMACAGNWLILRVPDADTADYMSRTLGDRQIIRTIESESGGSDRGSGWNKSEQYAIERAVLPSQIQNLKDLEGYLSVPGDFPIAKVKLEVEHMEKVAQSEISKDNQTFMEWLKSQNQSNGLSSESLEPLNDGRPVFSFGKWKNE